MMLQKNLRIVSFALTRAMVDAYFETIKRLERHGYRVNHVGLVDPNCPQGSTVAEVAYRQYHWPVTKISPGLSHQALREFIERFCNHYQPDVFLIDNERPLMVSIIKIISEKKIPIVFIGNCPFSPTPLIYNNWFLRLLKKSVDAIKIFFLPSLLTVPPGCQGDYEMCVYAGKDFLTLRKYGVNEKRIHLTGYPYFDKAFKKAIKQKQKRKLKKILIVSTGWGILTNCLENALNFYNFVIQIANVAKRQNRYSFFLRLKPGEDINSFLPQDKIEKIKSCGISLIKTETRSLDILNKYDGIIGDASQVLIEALILRKPILVFKYGQTKSSIYNSYNKDIKELWQEKLHVLTLERPAEILSFLPHFFSKKYLNDLRVGFKKEEKELFCKLDGKAGKRVADVIMDAVNRPR